ncbi:MAG: 4Fe-4S dicluster domain-containing protein [Bacteroidetes bacterium]|nr:4Fe-4S dicluster domain-containing protein [Bacteroidota bacterium]MBU1717886.1 4Fe-4S dicluster domain-containing protein [Bacteroidota bacterium]
MTHQIAFISALIITIGIFSWTMARVFSYMKFTRPYKIRQWPARFGLMMKVAIGQTKIFRFPILGFLHALVFWGFCVILVGSLEMVIDGVAGTDRVLSFLGPVYNILMALGDISAIVIAFAIIVFLIRRWFLNVKRFSGIEMKHKSHTDASIALLMILFLMISLLGINTFYVAGSGWVYEGVFPVSAVIAPVFKSMSVETTHLLYEICWWSHILLIFVFVNTLPYSKHFHVFMSVPNVFLSRLEPLGKLTTMENITREIKLMMNPETAFAAPTEEQTEVCCFGVKDVEDVTWKNYLDSLACTECGRCTSVCPANITGKKLSPRKVMIDLRARMKEKGPGLVKNGRTYNDQKSLVRDYMSTEELWACTTCNACAMECPININHPSLIVDMRRFLVMEESAAPAELNTIFSNIENNGAPWQFSPEDRILWTEELFMNPKTKA